MLGIKLYFGVCAITFNRFVESGPSRNLYIPGWRHPNTCQVVAFFVPFRSVSKGMHARVLSGQMTEARKCEHPPTARPLLPSSRASPVLHFIVHAWMHVFVCFCRCASAAALPIQRPEDRRRTQAREALSGELCEYASPYATNASPLQTVLSIRPRWRLPCISPLERHPYLERKLLGTSIAFSVRGTWYLVWCSRTQGMGRRGPVFSSAVTS